MVREGIWTKYLKDGSIMKGECQNNFEEGIWEVKNELGTFKLKDRNKEGFWIETRFGGTVQGEYSYGTRVGDWTVTNEHGVFILENGCKDGFIKFTQGEKIVEGILEYGERVGEWKSTNSESTVEIVDYSRANIDLNNIRVGA